jgi:hypothetical protein
MGRTAIWQLREHDWNYCLSLSFPQFPTIRLTSPSITITIGMRRQALNPYFSKQSVTKLEPAIQAVIENLSRRLREFRESKEPVNLGNAYAALTMDIISEYCFAKSYGCVDRPDFAPEWPKVMEAASAQSALNKQFPSILKFFKMMPESVVEKLNPEMMLLIHFQKVGTTKYLPRVIINGGLTSNRTW